MPSESKTSRGTGASTFLKSIVSLLYFSVGMRELYSVRRNNKLVLPVVFNMRVFDIYYVPSPNGNTCKELEPPPLLSQLQLSCVFISGSVRRNKKFGSASGST